MQESNLLHSQNARKVAVKVLVKDDIPLFLQQKTPIYQKNYYPEAKSDLCIYDPFGAAKNLGQKYSPKTLQESMLSLCQQYSNSMQLFPYFNYYHPSLLNSLNNQEEDVNAGEHRD